MANDLLIESLIFFIVITLESYVGGGKTQAPSAKPAQKSAHKTQGSERKSSQKPQRTNKPKKVENAAMGNAFADAFAKLKK